MIGQDCEQLTLFQADSLASRLVLPGSAEAKKMTVTSGRKCLELYRRSGPLGSLVKMLLGSSTWRSTRCYLTWKASATPAKRLLFRLVPSMPRTEETDVRLLPTPTATIADHPNQMDRSGRTGLQMAERMWPTPTERDCKGANSVEHLTRDGKRNHTDQLANAVRMFPTPKAQNARGTGQRHGNGGPSLDVVAGGQLNPTWVEWLMGFPIGWTDLDA